MELPELVIEQDDFKLRLVIREDGRVEFWAHNWDGDLFFAYLDHDEIGKIKDFLQKSSI